jgi:hypothetical protein
MDETRGVFHGRKKMDRLENRMLRIVFCPRVRK